jgi:serine/threonine protein kinase
MIQLLKAVSHLHQCNILHRDLKLSNILFDSKGCIKLADFGLARKIGNYMIQYSPKVATLWYRSPEILLRTGYYSKPCDAW